jgi:hypothetical protein
MLERYISKFWTQVFNDSVFIDNLLNGLEDRYAQTEQDISVLNNALSRYTIDVYRKQLWLFTTYTESQMNQDAMTFDQEDIFFNGVYQFGDSTHTFFTLPIDSSIKKIPFITSSPVNPEIILQENVDYMVNYEQNLIFFRDNPFNMNFNKRFVESSDDPDLGIALWLYHADKDYNDIDDIYAKTVKLNVQSSEYFKRIVNAIWDLRVEGGTLNNVNKLLTSTIDADFITTGGELTKIFSEGDREWVEISGKLYSAPSGTEVLPNIGDTILDGQMIWGGVQIFTGLDDIDFDSFPALQLGPNFIGNEFTGGVLVENVEYPFPDQELLVLVSDEDSFYLVEDLSETALTYLAEGVDGFIIDLLVTDTDADYQVISTRRDLPYKGREDTVEAFKQYLLGQYVVQGADITEAIIRDNHGQVPETINLFKEYQQRAFKNNAFFVSIDTNLIPSGVDPGMFLSYIKFTVPAYTTLLTFLSSSSTVNYSTSNISEAVDAFHVVDVVEDYAGENITDNVNRKLSI